MNADNIKPSEVGIFIQESLNMLINESNEIHGLVYNSMGIYYRSSSLPPYNDALGKSTLLFSFDRSTYHNRVTDIVDVIIVLNEKIYIKGNEYDLISISEFNENKFQFSTVMSNEDMDLYELCTYLHIFKDTQYLKEKLLIICYQDVFKYYKALTEGVVKL